MKIVYQAPLMDMERLNAENIICASGGNEDFGQKPGSYDFLKPFENFFTLF